MDQRPNRPTIEAGIEAIRRRWPDLANPREDEPVFVLSAGWRSGSTFLQRLLMPRCLMWGEPYGHAGLIDTLAGPIRCMTDAWPEPDFFVGTDGAGELSRHFVANLYPRVEDLLRAHQAFFDTLFAEPARRLGSPRWGFKEVRLGIDHAVYLKWLFPRARFLFLVRDPLDAYRSYAAREAEGHRWYRSWPDEPLTPERFGRHWRELARGFLDHHRKVDGLLVRYEDLSRGDFDAVERHVGFELSREAASIRADDGGPPPLAAVPDAVRLAIADEVGEVAERLGYAPTRVGHAEVITITPGRQVPLAATSRPEAQPLTPHAGPAPPRCVVLVPVGHHIEPECEEGLRQLEHLGYPVRRVRGYAAIDQARNQMATDALADGFDELMWIDSDIAFQPAAVERLRSHGVPIACVVYPKKRRRALACQFPPGTASVTFGRDGGLVDLDYAGMGFMLTRRGVYESIREAGGLPTCNLRFGKPLVPYFQPMTIPDPAGSWYLAEDYAFCHRARACGHRVLADTTIRIAHVGTMGFSWEEAGSTPKRFGAYTFHLDQGTA